MFNIVLRARKDAKAIRYISEKDYAGFLKVTSLGGGRRFSEIEATVDSILEDPYVPLFLFGRTEKELALEVERVLAESGRPHYVEVLRTKAVRNMRTDELRRKLEEIKTRMRLGMEWKEGYVLNPKNPFGLELDPDYDAYIALEGFEEIMQRLLGIKIGKNSLILRKRMNQETYYSGRNLVAEVSKVIGEPTKVEWYCPCIEDVELNELLRKNETYIRNFERASISFLKDFEGRPLIPWSGGKDSTAVLLLAKKAFRDVTAVYVKMEYEMPMTDEYVERVASLLGVDLVKVSVPMPLWSYGLPRHTNRWCTAMKVEAIEEVAEKLGANFLVTGDRDPESARRRVRPPVFGKKRPEVMPIKYWSGFMVQLYLLLEEIPLHPLYHEGFYRLGCTVCPSLSEWEIKILKELELPPNTKPHQKCHEKQHDDIAGLSR